MPSLNSASKIAQSEQEIANQGFDGVTNVPASQSLGFDGTATPKRQLSDTLAVTIQKSGTDTYIGQAAPGTALSASKWQAQKIDASGNVTWADQGGFTQVGTDLTALTYN